MNCKEIIEVNGINDKFIRGKVYWKFIILNVFNCKKDPVDALKVETLLRLLRVLIPCDECTAHYQQNLIDYLPTSKRHDKLDMIEFIVNTYNKIELINERRDNHTRETLVDKYIGEELREAIAICNGD